MEPIMQFLYPLRLGFSKPVQHSLFYEWKHNLKPLRLGGHIVPFQWFHKISGAPPETLQHFKYDAPEEVQFDPPPPKFSF